MMNTQTTIPASIWDAKKFHWKLFMKGNDDALPGCPNWLYEAIRQIKTSGQAQDDTIHLISSPKHLYAVKTEESTTLVYTKKV
ncbi:MAG: hypothetical protein PHV74_07565 [Dehalococcoidia bacterium]|nr:hypothetical protein [Dehalococcoidia bacterium]